MERLDRIKQHLKDHRQTYYVGGVCFVVGAASVVGVIANKDGAEVVQKVIQFGFRNEATPMIVNMIERSTPSKPVHLLGTNLFFNSISEAARETGHHVRDISKNVNGIVPNVKGDVFQLLQPAG